MQKGFGALQQSIAAAKARSEFSGARLSYLNWKNGDRKVVRFLTNDIITATTYSFVNTNDGKTQGFLVDPDKGDFVQKYASPIPGGPGWQTNFVTKQPEPPKGREQSIGLVVLRDLVPRDGGGFQVADLLTVVDHNGQQFRARTFGIVQQGHGNFWAALQGYHDVYGTICDRDYVIKREGGDKDTKYVITPVDPIPEMASLEVLQAHYGYGAPRGKDDPERFLYCPQTLDEWADYYSSEERARSLLLDPGQAAPAAPPTPQFVSAYNPVPPTPQFVPAAPAPVAPVTMPDLPQFIAPAADEAQAVPVVAPSQSTDLASLRDKLLAPK
jgi:hypothetical protein